jgi:hypothetical protein
VKCEASGVCSEHSLNSSEIGEREVQAYFCPEVAVVAAFE